MLGGIALLLAVALADPALAQAERAWFFEMDNAVEYGPIDGFVQVPAGGMPGSTSPRRPMLEELGIDDVVLYELGLRAGWRSHTLLGGVHIVRLSGDAVLASDLTTHNVLYPAGRRLRSDIALDWYDFGYGYRFDLPGGLSVTPAFDFVLLGFDYKVTDGLTPTGRSYTKFGYRLGGEIAWQGRDRFDWLELRTAVFGGLPIGNSVEILSAELVARARVWHVASAQLGLFLGIAYDLIEYRDDQLVPNHIDTQLGPLLKAGVSVRF